jgi:hypothetical protein
MSAKGGVTAVSGSDLAMSILVQGQWHSIYPQLL